MASAPVSLDNLPEPRELHARLSERRRLEWEDPLPTKRELAKEFGEVAAVASLAMLARIADAEHLVTEDFVAAVPPRSVSYQLESRVKSPRSLARKISASNAHRSKPAEPQDVLRYTVRADARGRCIALSDGMRRPAGLGELSELGGVPVAVRSYGEAYGRGAMRPGAAVPPAEAGKGTAQQVAMDLQQGKGMGR
ncbi:hypothetical protein [Kribbella sp. CA-294648]|uniref:hypothetical protein n=1 Tax=Kribbella sp. CA-294648 TaxID=3239948 RepID=UPI003D8D8792